MERIPRQDPNATEPNLAFARSVHPLTPAWSAAALLPLFPPSRASWPKPNDSDASSALGPLCEAYKEDILIEV